MLHTNGGEPVAAPPPADTGLQKGGGLNRTWWEIAITFSTADSKFLRVFVGDLETIP
jgi:hypothetical protein